MGFKCPCCHKDFGFRKEKWEEHINACGDGITKSIVDAVLTGDTKPLSLAAKKLNERTNKLLQTETNEKGGENE